MTCRRFRKAPAYRIVSIPTLPTRKGRAARGSKSQGGPPIKAPRPIHLVRRCRHLRGHALTFYRKFLKPHPPVGTSSQMAVAPFAYLLIAITRKPPN